MGGLAATTDQSGGSQAEHDSGVRDMICYCLRNLLLSFTSSLQNTQFVGQTLKHIFLARPAERKRAFMVVYFGKAM